MNHLNTVSDDNIKQKLSFEEFNTVNPQDWITNFCIECAKEYLLEKTQTDTSIDISSILAEFSLIHPKDYLNPIPINPIYSPLYTTKPQSRIKEQRDTINTGWQKKTRDIYQCHCLPILDRPIQEYFPLIRLLEQRNISHISLDMNFNMDSSIKKRTKEIIQHILSLKNNSIKKIQIENVHYKLVDKNQWLQLDPSFVNLPNKQIKIVLFFDPLAQQDFILNNKKNTEMNKWLRQLTNNTDDQIQNGLQINGHEFHNNGGNSIQELAFLLNKANDYLQAISDSKNSINHYFNEWHFSISVSSFMLHEIAKIRALRLLWINIISQYPNLVTSDLDKAIVYTKNASWNKTLFDPYVNILRNSLESAIAIWGTADAVSTAPYNQLYAPLDPFGHRIALNQFLLLSHEGFAQKVLDPFRGTYAIEDLTEKNCKQSWTLFQEIEKQGGYLEAVQNLYIPQKIFESRKKLIDSFHTSQLLLIGANAYSQKQETITQIIQKNLNNFSKEFVLKSLENAVKENFLTESFSESLEGFLGNQTPFRLAQYLEYLRLKTEIFLESQNSCNIPIILLDPGSTNTQQKNLLTGFLNMAMLPYEIINHNEDDTNLEKKIQATNNPIIAIIGNNEDIYLQFAKRQKSNTTYWLIVSKKPEAQESNDNKQAALTDKENPNEFIIYLNNESNIVEVIKKIQKIIGIV